MPTPSHKCGHCQYHMKANGDTPPTDTCCPPYPKRCPYDRYNCSRDNPACEQFEPGRFLVLLCAGATMPARYAEVDAAWWAQTPGGE